MTTSTITYVSRGAFNKAVALAVQGSRFARSLMHGEDHWRAVATQGLRLAHMCDLGPEGRSAAALFGLFHDCRRLNDDRDPEHGLRGSHAFLSCPSLQGLDAGFRETLAASMVLHDGGETTDDPIKGIGWDADRSVLTRVGINPAFRFFSVLPEEQFDVFVETGYDATSNPLDWDQIWLAAFGT